MLGFYCWCCTDDAAGGGAGQALMLLLQLSPPFFYSPPARDRPCPHNIVRAPVGYPISFSSLLSELKPVPQKFYVNFGPRSTMVKILDNVQGFNSSLVFCSCQAALSATIANRSASFSTFSNCYRRSSLSTDMLRFSNSSGRGNDIVFNNPVLLNASKILPVRAVMPSRRE